MSSTKLIVVVGATGTQGGSVARTFLSLTGWRVRSVTRSPDSEKAKKLASLGSEVVQAELSDIESLHRAFAGANAIFVNTDFWGGLKDTLTSGKDHDTSLRLAYDIELQNARNTAIAASKVATLERYVYSALGPINEYSGGKYTHALHWEAKAAAVKYIESNLLELSKKTSFIYIGAYTDNSFLFPQLNPSTGTYASVLPASEDTHLLIIDADKSTGLYVRALIEDEEPGLSLLAYDDDITVAQAIEQWSKVTGEKADFVSMSLQSMHDQFNVPWEVLDAVGFVADFGYTAGIKTISPGDLKNKPKQPSFQEFLVSKGKEALLKPEADKA